MRLFTISIILLMNLLGNAEAQQKKQKALVLIDIQNFYFPGGSAELVDAEEAANYAAKVLWVFRSKGYLVVHVKHQVQSGGEIYKSLTPLEEERVIVKTDVNAFKNTDLKDYLEQKEVRDLVVVGMQTHMCLEAAVRAAADYNYNVTVVSDACTTRELSFNGVIIPAMHVHFATLSTLKSYAEVISFEDFEKKFLN